MIRFTVAPLVVSLVGCVTGGAKEPARMPADAATLFKACAPADGGILATIKNGDARIGSGELEWVAKPGAFEAELTGPLGETLLSLHWHGSGGPLKVGGALAEKVPPVKVTKRGYLDVDGHFVGLKAAEMACVFQAALPPAWLGELVSATVDDGRHILVFKETARRMTVTLAAPGPGEGGYCAEVAWPVMVVFSRTLSWCVETRDKPDRGTLTGLGDYSLAWNKLTEQTP